MAISQGRTGNHIYGQYHDLEFKILMFCNGGRCRGEIPDVYHGENQLL
jgi:hypothetical protein